MSDHEYKAEVDILAVALTRQPVLMGVNLRMFFGNLMLSTLICIDAQTLYGIGVGIVVHMYMVAMSNHDPNHLYIYGRAFIKTPPIFNRSFWGKLNNYEPW